METLSYCQLMQRCGELEAQVKQLAAERDAVVAENATLKAFGDKLYSMYKGLETSGGGFHDDQSISYQQFNMFVEKLRNQIECAKLHGDQYEKALWMAISYVSLEALINHA